MDTLIDILSAALYASIFLVVSLIILGVGYLVFDAITPGHKVGERLNPLGQPSAASHSAALVLGTWMLAQAAIIFTSIWNNAHGTDFWLAIGWTVAFSVIGLLLQTAAFLALDFATPGKLGDEVCTPGPVVPLAKVAAANVAAVGIIVIACIS